MQSLFEFFYRNRALALFVLLEVFSGWMIVRFNSYQGSSFFNSSNVLTGSVLQTTDNVKSYFNLRSVNKTLSEENASLRGRLASMEYLRNASKEIKQDSQLLNQFTFISAKVINNSVNKGSNFFTLDKGADDGLKPGMGILSANGGVSGRIKECSEHYSTAISVLNDKWALSAKVTRSNADGVLEWKGGNPREAELIHVGKHHKVFEGDTIVTSGYSSVFPYGLIIGRVKSVVDDGSKYVIKVTLRTDYTAMSYVSVISNHLKEERDSLELNAKLPQE